MTDRNYADHGFQKANSTRDRWQDWDEAWAGLGRRAIEYSWKYRQKICTKCPRETQVKWDCYRVNRLVFHRGRYRRNRWIPGKFICETHCDKMVNAQANHMRRHVNAIWDLSPLIPANNSDMHHSRPTG